jgi:hypothetical protein
MFDYSLHWLGRLFASAAFFCALVAAFAASKSDPNSPQRVNKRSGFWQSTAVRAAILAALFSALASFF